MARPSDLLAIATIVAGTGLGAAIDLWTRRVPNPLPPALAASRRGLAACGVGHLSIGASLAGIALGLALMLPGHLFGATGAGDVKLFAAAGAFIGPAHILARLSLYRDCRRRSSRSSSRCRGSRLRADRSAAPRRLIATVGAERVGAIESPVRNNRFAYAPGDCRRRDARRPRSVKEMAMTRIRARLAGESGQALLETALTLPLLLLVSVGIFEFGRAYQTVQVVTNAAREGARLAVMPGQATGAVDTRVRDYMTVGTAAQRRDRDRHRRSGRRPWTSAAAARATASLVTVGYPFQFMVLQPVVRLLVAGRDARRADHARPRRPRCVTNRSNRGVSDLWLACAYSWCSCWR